MRKILVFDESGHTVYEIYKYFSIFYDITEVQSSADALSKLNTEKFDVLLIKLNNDTGSEEFNVLRELNNRGITRFMVIVALTNELEEYQNVFLNALKFGADDCIAEPINQKMLLVKLEKMLNNIVKEI